MSHPVIATRRQPWSRRVVALFSVVALNLAMQPCAMALAGDDDCLRCPPAHEHDMASHHGHVEAVEKAPCLSLDSQCAETDEISLDGRAGELTDVLEAPIAAVDTSALTAMPANGRRFAVLEVRQASRASPPLYVLHCVYLK